MRYTWGHGQVVHEGKPAYCVLRLDNEDDKFGPQTEVVVSEEGLTETKVKVIAMILNAQDPY